MTEPTPEAVVQPCLISWTGACSVVHRPEPYFYVPQPGGDQHITTSWPIAGHYLHTPVPPEPVEEKPE